MSPDVVVMDLEEEGARDVAFRIALSMYLGEQCRFCGRTYETFEDLKETVYAGYHEHGRLACKTCWNAQLPETIAALKAQASRD
jgi:hypothetical protein